MERARSAQALIGTEPGPRTLRAKVVSVPCDPDCRHSGSRRWREYCHVAVGWPSSQPNDSGYSYRELIKIQRSQTRRDMKPQNGSAVKDLGLLSRYLHNARRMSRTPHSIPISSTATTRSSLAWRVSCRNGLNIIVARNFPSWSELSRSAMGMMNCILRISPARRSNPR